MLRYKYYDTPDGQDVLKKIFVTGKYATLTGLGCSTLDVILYSKPKGYLEAVARYGTITLPLVGLAATFTTGTYLATNFRKKDDVYNYMFGGCCSGIFWGALKRSYLAGSVASFAFALIGFIKKTGVENGYEFIPDARRREDGILWMQRHDWTIMKDLPKSWTSGDSN